MHVKEKLAAKSRLVESYLQTCLDDPGIPAGLREAMLYSLLAGGKRLRPALCLTFAGLNGLPAENVLAFACGFELIHTYSLIHDDLPAMDNDDLRRGKPSNHKAYGEAMAILAGDALLTEAFGLMCLTKNVAPQALLAALSCAARAAGAAGMVGGQVLDMAYTSAKGINLEQLREMQSLKTGALILAACRCGALLAGAEAKAVEQARLYGEAIGRAFQIVDDILDVVGDEASLGKPVGSDQGLGKTTYPSLLGLAKSRELAAKQRELALRSLSGQAGEEADFLRELAAYVVERVQ